jgi:hypothetical protein
MVAALLDQPGIGDGRYGFTSIDIDALGAESPGIADGAAHDSSAVACGARMLRFEPLAAGTLAFDVASRGYADLVVHSVTFDPADPAGATVVEHPVAGADTHFEVTVAGDEAVDLVVAVVPPASVPELQGAPMTAFSYTATLLP